MTIPSTPFSGCDCCGYGFEIFESAAMWEALAIFFSANFTFDPPDGSADLSVTTIIRDQNTFDEIKWFSSATTISTMLATRSITVDDQGNYYAAHLGGVRKFDSEYNTLWTDGTAGTLTNSVVWVDRSHNVYVIRQPNSSSAYSVRKLNSSGSLVWAYTGANTMSSFEEFTGLCVDLNGEVTISVRDTLAASPFSIQHLDSGGSFAWKVTTTLGGGGLIHAHLATDASGNIYSVRRQTGAQIFAYDSSGSPLWSRHFGGGALNMNQSMCICLDANGDIFVGGRSSGTTTYQIKKINGSTQADIWTANLTTYLWAVHLAVDVNGDVYMAADRSDSGANNYASQRKFRASDGVSIASAARGVENVQSFAVAAFPGRHPHFIF